MIHLLMTADQVRYWELLELFWVLLELQLLLWQGN